MAAEIMFTINWRCEPHEEELSPTVVQKDLPRDPVR